MTECSPNPFAEAWLMSWSKSLNSVPPHMRDSIIYYILRGVPLGGFLTAVFSDSLVEATGKADGMNIQILPAYANFLYNYAPRDSWGSREKVAAWEAGAGVGLAHQRFPAEWERDVAAVVASIKAEGGER